MIVLTYDHGGYEIMQKIKTHLDSLGLEYIDVNGKYEPSDSYVEYGVKANVEMLKHDGSVGIYMCRSGVGMTIVANKGKGIRAANCFSEKIAEMSRRHNEANVCVLPADYIDFDTMLKVIDTFLNTEFEGGRHKSRVDALNAL
ncbi:MAG: RpiB/LacA/LacB family sugar-phosphate isomerase [Clostridia bacterium]|nr:RpiB/LacA/LacB family sugar-phosphate isomerase [Clostridia bacterium]